MGKYIVLLILIILSFIIAQKVHKIESKYFQFPSKVFDNPKKGYTPKNGGNTLQWF